MARRARITLKRRPRQSIRRRSSVRPDQIFQDDVQNGRIARMEEERRIEKAAFAKLQQDLVEVRSRYDSEVKALKIKVGILEHERCAKENQVMELTTAMGSAEDSISNYANLLKTARTSSKQHQPTFVSNLQAELFRTIHKVEVLSNQQQLAKRTSEETITSLEENMTNALKEKATVEAALRAQIDNLQTENDLLEKRLRFNKDENNWLKMKTNVLFATRDAMSEDLGEKSAVEKDLTAKLKKAEETISLMEQVNEANANVIAKLYSEMGVEDSSEQHVGVNCSASTACVHSTAA